jgi:LPS export ABC transporter protein LptC
MVLKMALSSRKLIRWSLLLVVLGVSGILAVAVWKGTVRKGQQPEVVSEPTDAEMKLTDMEYVEMQEGKRLWALKASEATYFQGEQKTALKLVHLTFFLDDGDEAYLESRDGALYAGTKNIELWNDVRATFPRGYELSSDRAYYDHGRNLITSETPIQVTGPEFTLSGQRWEYAIPERQAKVEGGVRARVMFSPARNTRE